MKVKLFTALCLLLATFHRIQAQQIVEVLPVTDRILMLHFDEGTVNKHQRGQRRGDESVNLSPLNVTAATTLTSYQLSSPDDASYASPRNPTDIGRKSKGMDWTFLCQGYGAAGCENTSPDHAKEHWLYLYLPAPLQRGKSYTLNTGQLGSNGSTWTLVYDEKQIRSEAVHVNQIGYKPNAGLKYGYVYHWLGDKGGLDLASYTGKPFWVVNTATSQVAFTGTVQLAKSKSNPETGQSNDTPDANFAGADVYECNFSALTTPGDYVLAVEGVGRSFPFRIGQDVYREVFSSVMNGLYKNRSGINIIQGELSDQNRPAPHNPNLTPGFSNRLFYSTARDYDYVTDGGGNADRAGFEAGKKGLINTWGWYQDAGDWDGYFSHTRVPINLMFLYEVFPASFTDNALLLPERNNGQPDILDEARWLVRYFHRTRHAIMDAGYGTGGVGGARAFGDLWGSDTRQDETTKASWDDTDRDWYISGEDVWTTFRYAGMAAQYAYCLNKAGVSDAEGINWQQEATEAWTWAFSKQTPADETPKRDFNLKSDRLYAAAMLYRLTGNALYHDQFKADFNSVNLSQITLEDDIRFGLWAYATLPENRPAEASIVSAILAKAESTGDDVVIGTATRRAARWGGNFYFPMLVGQGTSPMLNEGIMAYHVLRQTNPGKTSEYLKYIGSTADYFLGNNPLNQTWITGLGERYPREIFHMDSWYSGSGTTRTGIVPYGPWRTDSPRPAQLGWWSHMWPERKGLYPANMDVWPGHERWFDQRTSPLSAEWTIHQSQLWSIMTYGMLFAVEEPRFEYVPVTGITVNPVNVTIFAGQSVNITASVQPGKATNPSVVWTSADPATAKVVGGTITGVKAGTTTITARTIEGNFTAQVTVTVTSTGTFTCTNNLAQNGSFEETNLAMYQAYPASQFEIVSDPASGFKAGKLGISADGYMHQILFDAPKGRYTYRVKVKRMGTPSYAGIKMRFQDAVGKDLPGTKEFNIANGEYQEFTVGPVEAPATLDKVLMMFYVGPGGSLFIDDLCLTVESSNPAPVSCPGNRFVNTSFEDADLSAYDVRNNVSIVSDARSGSKAAQIGTGTADGYMHQQLYNAPQGNYTFQAWTKRNGTPGYAIAMLKFVDAAGQEIKSATRETNIPAGLGYQPLTLGPFPAPAGTSKVLVGFAVGSGGTVLIDDLCLTVSDGRTVLTPTHDKDNDGNGTSPVLHASQFTSAFYKFDLSAVSGTPARAVLRLHKLTAVAYLAHLGVHPDNQDGWTETDGTNPANATVISTRSIAGGTGPVVEFDVTDYIRAELGTDRNQIASFQVNNNYGSWTDIGSKESIDARPELIITLNNYTDTQAPSAPSSLTATEIAQAGFRLSWAQATDNAGVMGYDVYNGNTLVATLPGRAYSFLVKGLTPGTGYTFSVQARDEAGNATASAPLAVKTAPVSAPAVTLSPTDDTSTEDNALGTGAYGTHSLYARAFTRFDLSNVQGNITQAKLRLYVLQPMKLFLKETNTKDWSEGNRSALPQAVGEALVTKEVAAGNTYIELDVTSLVQSAFALDKVLSWAFSHDTGPWKAFSTKEAYANQPELVLTLSGDKLNVQYMDGDNKQVANNHIKPHLRLINEGTTTVPYQELTVRYWFTSENHAAINTWIDYAQLGNQKVKMKYVPLSQPRHGANGYIEYSFDASAGNLAPGGNSGLVQSRFAKQTWTNFNESDDYSYADKTSYNSNDRITLYRKGQLIWGREPEPAPASLKLKVLSENKNPNPSTNSISTFLNLVNEGNVPVDYQDIKVRYWFTAEGTQPLNYWVDYAQPGNGKIKGQFTRLNPVVSKADTYFELTFDASAGTLYPLSQTGNIQYRIAKSNWSAFNETNDHSYKSAGPMAENDQITVYYKGALVYGTEPHSAARLASPETDRGLRATLLENPVSGDQVSVEVKGAEGQALHLELTDIQGRPVIQRLVKQAAAIERQTLFTGLQPVGVLLLRISTNQQFITLKVLKQ